MNTFKSTKELIQELLDKGFTAVEIAEKAECGFSAICKVARGVQGDLPYAIGKRIELLNARTRRRKKTL
jgi:2-keto-3-deoxy-6-phosphogluconate aldolase